MRSLLAITKALSDQNRIRILCALWERDELCVCQIHELLGLAASTASKHLSLLAAAGLVDVRKDGRWSYYRLAQEDAPENAGEVLLWVCRQASTSKLIAGDRKKLDQILSISPEELCQRQADCDDCCPTTQVVEPPMKRRINRT